MLQNPNSNVDDAILQKLNLAYHQYRIDRNQGTFDFQRLEAMKQSLTARGFTNEAALNHIIENMSWKMLVRDSDGFLTSKSEDLVFPQGTKTYSYVIGIRINEAGTVEPLISQALAFSYFSSADVDLVLKQGISNSSFSLDPLLLDTRVQPLQRATYNPSQIGGSESVKTLLHTDYLLKMLCNGWEVSANVPFRQRSTQLGLLLRLPEEVRDAMTPVYARKETMFQEKVATSSAVKVAASRMWLECSEVDYIVKKENGWTTYTLDANKVEVKLQIFRELDPKTEAIDTNTTDWLVRAGLVEIKEQHEETAEEAFVREFNGHIHTLCVYYPHLERLSQLHRLSSLSKILQMFSQENPALLSKIQSQGFAVRAPEWLKDNRNLTGPLQSLHVVPTAFMLDCTDSTVKTDNEVMPIGSIVDFQDDDFTWYTAEVINKSEDLRLFHYDGWDSKFDVWRKITSPGIAPKNTYTPVGRSAGAGTGVFRPPPIGTRVRAQKPGALLQDMYTTATVIESTQNTMKVRYDDARLNLPDITVPPLVWGQVSRIPEIMTPTAADIIEQKVFIGQDVDVRDEFYSYYSGSVLEKNLATRTVKIRFHSWGPEWDRWVPIDSTHLAPLHTHTPLGIKTQIVNQLGQLVRIGLKPVSPPVGTPVVAFNVTTNTFCPAIVTNSVQGDGVEAKVTVSFVDNVGPIKFMTSSIVNNLVRERTLQFNSASVAEVSSGQLKPGQDIDVRDEHYGWYTATVVSSSDSRVEVRYHGWDSLHNEFIDRSLLPQRIAPLHHNTLPGFQSAKNSFGPVVPPPSGSRVFARSDINNTFCPGTLTTVSPNDIEVRFDDGKTISISKPIGYGLLQDMTPITRSLVGISNCAYGGVKICPIIRQIPKSEIDDTTKRINNALTSLRVYEGNGGDNVSNIPTAPLGVTEPARNQAKKFSGNPNLSDKEVPRVYLLHLNSVLSQKMTGYTNAPEKVKECLLDLGYNMGEVIISFKELSNHMKAGNYKQALISTLDTANTNNKTVIGIAARRAKEYNKATSEKKIKKVVQEQDGEIIYYYADDTVCFRYGKGKGRHSASKSNEIIISQ